MSNALKFTFKGHIKVKVEKQDSYHDISDTQLPLSIIEQHYDTRFSILVSVEDTGIGIKQDDIGKLFKMFGKLKQSGDVNPSGIGLGLTICNNILLQYGS